jgi:phosphoglycerol transferase MdoB-like AlkP superfamily enzyme
MHQKRITGRLSNFIDEIQKNNKKLILSVIAFSILLTFILEFLSRRSIREGLGFIFVNPLMFIVNVLIILLTLSFALIFSRRGFFLILFSSVWLGLGIANEIIQSFRLTPLTAMDFYLLKSGFGIIRVYLNPVQIFSLLIAAAILFGILILLWRKVKKNRIQIKIPMVVISITLVLMFGISAIAVKVNALSKNFGNLMDAYSNYGFVYCFSNSVFDRGIKRPGNYSEDKINQILESLEKQNDNQKTDKVNANIIMVQLESFIDVNELIGYSYSKNPIPNFTKLKEDYSYGYLTVPAYGAGTINTEFEILTGMNTKFFGTGEYPYRTVLQSQTCESICYDLSELGYHTYAIHNNTGTFYDRRDVFKRLGFDNFDSIEYMNNIELNAIGWSKDHVLTAQILNALNADEAKDFIYTITVQSHGKYPASTPVTEPEIKLLTASGQDKSSSVDGSIGENFQNEFEYYLNQLTQTDQFIGELTEALSDYDEPTVVVFYGDHLPPLSFDNEDLENSNKFQTEYILWSNFPMEKVNQDMNAYQLNAYVMGRLGYDNGTLTKFHQSRIGQPGYEEELKLLQYDMLYGNRYVYDKENPYTETDMVMGINETKITDVVDKEEGIYLFGENFTPWSVVYIDNKPCDTEFVSSSSLIVPEEKLADKEIYVAQVTDKKVILSKSKEWVSNE